MNLIIVESPTKAKTISRFLGKDYKVEATMGHIKDLPKNKLAVDVKNNFKPFYVVVEKKKELIKNLKLKSKGAEFIYLATDPDREGEAIAAHVKEILTQGNASNLDKNKSEKESSGLNVDGIIKRIVFHEITQEAIKKALDNPRDINQNLVNAQTARRVLDRLVGYKLSPLLWKKIRRGLSAGRVQSVALRLIVEKEREIESFVPKEYWEIYCELIKRKKSTDKSFKVKLIKVGGKRIDITNKEEAQKIVGQLEKSSYSVYEVRERQINKKPYPPFTTSTMTQAASRIFGWSAKKTMSLAQKLYEEGLITYHRTDSTNLSEASIKSVRNFIREEFGEKYLPAFPRYYKRKSKLAQEAHEAIRPTDVRLTVSKLPMVNGLHQAHKKLYELIWKRFVACQMSDSIVDETVIDVNAKYESSRFTKEENLGDQPKFLNYLLRTSGQVLKFDGWRKVISITKEEEVFIPKVKKGEALDLLKVFPEQKFTQPPARYTEASLIKTLEKLGIGRPSTYAPIISTIQIRNYVEKIEGKFKPTPVGFAVSDFLVENFPDIIDYSFTAEMEDELDDIAKGELEWTKMMKDFYFPFEEKLEKVSENSKRVKIAVERLGGKCPNCKTGELVIRIGKFGKFVSCSQFPKCNYKQKYVEKLDLKCPKCGNGEVLIKTTKKGKKFYSCSDYPKCDWASWRKPESLIKN